MILRVHKAQTFLEKTIGLIGKKHAIPLLIQTRFGIHTFGLYFPIDVLILNKEHVVVTYKKNLKPNRLYFWNPLFDTIIELPAGTIGEKNIKVGTVIKVEENKP